MSAPLPHNLEAEQALLGAILVNNRTLETVCEFLRPEHFYDPAHGRIFAAANKLIERGQVANPLTLKGYFEADGDLAAVGGASYLVDLSASVVTTVNTRDHGKLIRDLYTRRELIEFGERIAATARTQDVDISPADQIQGAERQLFDLATAGEAQRDFVPFGDAIREALDLAETAFRHGGQISGLATGLRDLDWRLGGLHETDLLILAGRPSMGKTALATNIAFSVASADVSVGIFSAEMSADQLANRIMAAEARVSSEHIRRGAIQEKDFSRLAEIQQRLTALPLYIDDSAALTISAVRSRARRLKRTHGLGLLVIDYLQLLAGSGRSENRVQEISDITRGLKAIAKDLDIPVLALSQLSRAVEQREDKRPLLSDLRESGSIEQDADVVMFVYRDEYYLSRSEPTKRADESEERYYDRKTRWEQRCAEVKDVAEVIVAKQRHGPIGTVRLHFDGQLTRFSDLSMNHQMAV